MAARLVLPVLLASTIFCLAAGVPDKVFSPTDGILAFKPEELPDKDKPFYAISDVQRSGSLSSSLTISFTVTLLDQGHRDFLHDYEERLRPVILGNAHGIWREHAGGSTQCFNVTPEGMMLPSYRLDWSCPYPGNPPTGPVQDFGFDLSTDQRRAVLNAAAHSIGPDKLAILLVCAEGPLSTQP